MKPFHAGRVLRKSRAWHKTSDILKHPRHPRHPSCLVQGVHSFCYHMCAFSKVSPVPSLNRHGVAILFSMEVCAACHQTPPWLHSVNAWRGEQFRTNGYASLYSACAVHAATSLGLALRLLAQCAVASIQQAVTCHCSPLPNWPQAPGYQARLICLI